MAAKASKKISFLLPSDSTAYMKSWSDVHLGILRMSVTDDTILAGSPA